METNDETMIMTGREVNQPQENEDKSQDKKKSSWKNAAAGAAAGAAVGAGAMHAANAFGADANAHIPDNKAEDKPDAEQTDDTEDVKVAKADDDTSAQDATDSSDVADNTNDVHVAPAHSDDVDVVDDSNYTETSNDSDAGDVHVVGQGYVEGHMAATLDLDNNGDADIAVIDVNDNGQLDNPDLVVDSDGNAATIGDLVQAQNDMPTDDGYGYTGDDIDPSADPSMQQTAYENPDLSPDMPDYMDNADVSFT